MKDTAIYAKVSQQDKDRLDRLAESYRMNRSEFLRTMLYWIEEHQPRLIIEPKSREKEPA